MDGAGELPVQAAAEVRAGGPDRRGPGSDGSAAPIAESSLGWHNRIRLPRDHYVRIDTCDYSVDPAVIGRMVAVRADLEQVRVTCEGALVACHDRSWVAHQTITDPGHKAAADVMRAERLRAKSQRGPLPFRSSNETCPATTRCSATARPPDFPVLPSLAGAGRASATRNETKRNETK